MLLLFFILGYFGWGLVLVIMYQQWRWLFIWPKAVWEVLVTAWPFPKEW